MKTNLQVLNEISAKLGGREDGLVITEALNNIANALGDTEPDRIKTISESLEDILEYAGGGGGGGGDLNTVTATIVNNSESTKSYAFYGYDFINGSLPDSPILALQVKNGEYYAGTYSNEVSAGETDTAEIVMLSDAFYFDANQNAQVTGDATIAWDDVVESYIVTATDDFTLTYE